MAYGASSLYLVAFGAPGFSRYTYTTTDSMATVLEKTADGYFDNGPDAAPKLAVGDRIECYCSDGIMLLKVVSVNANDGTVTVQYNGGNLPIRTWATGTAAGDQGLSPGYYEVGTSISTSSRGVLPTPYPGAEVFLMKVDSGTQGFNIDAGASGSNISWIDGTVGGGTHITYDGSNRRFNLVNEGDWFRVVGSGDGSTGAGRWRVMGYFYQGSAVSEGASIEYPGT